MLQSTLIADFELSAGPDTNYQRVTEIERLENGDLALVWHENYKIPGAVRDRVRFVVLGEDGGVAAGGIQDPSSSVTVHGDVAPRIGGGFRTLAEYINPITFVSSWELQDYDNSGAYVLGPISPEPHDIFSFQFAALRDGGSALFLLEVFDSGDWKIDFYRHAANEKLVAGKQVAYAKDLHSAVLRPGATEADDRIVLLYGVEPDAADDPGDRIALIDLEGNVETVAKVPGALVGPEPAHLILKTLTDGGVVLGGVKAGAVYLQRYDANLKVLGSPEKLEMPAGEAGKVWHHWMLERPGGGFAELLLAQPADGKTLGSAWLQYISEEGVAVGAPQYLDDVPVNITRNVVAEFNAQGQLVMAWDQYDATTAIPMTVRVYDLDQPSDLTGVVFADANGNGRFDAGEGIAGATVTGTAGAVLADDPTDTTDSSGQWGLLLAPVSDVAISVEVGGTLRHAQVDLSRGFGPVMLRDGIEWITKVGLELGGGGDANLIGKRAAALIGDETDNTLLGNRSGNRLDGLGGADVLSGQGGNDRLRGGDGRDVVKGGKGDDRIEGEEGRDKLVGNDGVDSFVFGLGDGKDTIVDFDVTDASNGHGDRLVLSRALWGGDFFGSEDILATFSTVTARGVRLDFDGGESILLRGVPEMSLLVHSIDVIA